MKQNYISYIAIVLAVAALLLSCMDRMEETSALQVAQNTARQAQESAAQTQTMEQQAQEHANNAATAEQQAQESANQKHR